LTATRLAAAGGLLDTVLFRRNDQAAAGRQQIDRGGHGEVRVEQHRAAMRREVLDEKALRRRDVGIFDLIPRDALRPGDGVEQWRSLIQRDHAKVAVRVSNCPSAS
jgi:hypothetical protein